ncbi:SRPBCC family protein [Acinetobacter sp. YH12239]|uniref:SRPBCC family protein n=1 Tax=Acinetobacter sp. YH12239 TaxID=2601166 RepID=UPI0015D2E83B|nr:SRPBCC family protein [Acinetobacter sp. YH12239]
MKYFNYRALCLSLIFIPSLSYSAIIEWKENIPSALKPFQNNSTELASITKDQILIYAHPNTQTSIPTRKKHPNPNVKFTSSAIVLPVNEEKVAKTLSQFENFVGLFPTLKSAKILDQEKNITQVQYKISIPTPIPVLNFNETIVFQHHIEGNSISSLIVDAPVPYGLGKFEWFKLDQNHTLLTLTQWGDLNQPKGFLFSKVLNAVPEAKMGIPSGTHTFLLESIRKKLTAPSSSTLKPGQFPSDQLTTNQLAKIAQISRITEHPVSFVHTPTTVPYQHGAESMRFVTTYQYYSQPVQQLQKWTQPVHYKKLFPRQLKSIGIESLKDQTQLADFKVELGLGVIQIPFRFKLNFSFPQSNQNNFYAQGGDLKYIKGKMQFDKFQQGTLLKMTNAGKIDEKAPFLIRAARSLPYHDVLPTVGANVVFALKVKNEEQKQ